MQGYNWEVHSRKPLALVQPPPETNWFHVGVETQFITISGKKLSSSDVTDEVRGANRSPGKLKVKIGPPLSLYFAI